MSEEPPKSASLPGGGGGCGPAGREDRLNTGRDVVALSGVGAALSCASSTIRPMPRSVLISIRSSRLSAKPPLPAVF